MTSMEAINPEKTLALLWDRVKQQGDLPGFTRAITAILGAMRGEDDQGFNMTQTVLSDPALTQKVLRLANSAMYSAFGQSIGTVSKAVIVLGTETIGHLALGLKLIDELSAASPNTTSACMEMEKAVLAGNVARHVATTANYRDAEEAVVCSMLHTLGRMMVVFYLADYWTRIQECMQRPNNTGDENTTAVLFLGLSLEDIGRDTAERWGLPKGLVESMRELPPTAEPLGRGDWLAALSSMSSRCATALYQDEAVGDAAIADLVAGYSGMLGISPEAVMGAVNGAKLSSSVDLIAARSGKRALNAGISVGINASTSANTNAAPDPRLALHEILRHGISDMRDAQSSATPSQMIAMALETMYQGLDLRRAIAFLHQHKTAQYVAKMSFGAGAKNLLPQLVFDDVYHPDVFKMALSNDKLIFIENAQEPDFAPKLPHWWKSTLVPCKSFLILPLTLNNHPTAFIYGDWSAQPPTISLKAEEFALINEIRAILIHSLERRRQAAAVGTTAQKVGNKL
jgi:HD-like signal output (HDOD) protein